MDALNQAVAQLRELFRSLPPSSRMAAVLLAAVVLVSVGYLVRFQAAAPGTHLMGGEPFSSGQLAAMEAAFSRANLADYEIEGSRVLVPRGRQAAYMGALADAGALPPSFGSYLERALAGDGLFMNQRDKQERLKVAKQNELALILRSMQGIENASVIYDIQQGRGLNPQEIATASVNIKPLGSAPLEPARIPMIRSLVASAIAGMKRENVTVTDLNGRAYAGSEESGGDPLEDPYYARKRMYEQSLEQKIAQSLVYVPGVVVKVNAELDPQLRHVEESVKHAPHAGPRRQGEDGAAPPTSLSTGDGMRTGSGPTASGPADGVATIAAIARSFTGTTGSDDSKMPSARFGSYDRVQREIKGLTPRQVRVLVAIPSGYYQQVLASQSRAGGEPDPEELRRVEIQVKRDIESAIVPFLPDLPEGRGGQRQVTVTTFQSLPQPEPRTPSLAWQAAGWAGQYWAALGTMLVGLVSLLLLRGVLKGGSQRQGAASAAASPSPSRWPNEPLAHSVHGAHAQPGRPTWKEDLSEMVRENPDTAASILRNWIGKTS